MFNLYPINFSSQFWQATLNSNLIILILMPICSFFPPIFLKNFWSKRNWRNC